MKTLKVVGIVIAVLIVLIIVVGLIAPKHYSAERSVLIDAPRELVYDHIKYWKNWSEWSPWAEMDSAMTVTLEGEDGTVGAIYKWVGDPQITGKGEMVATGFKDYEEISYTLHFIEPYDNQSVGYARLTDENGKTRAAWGFSGETPFPWNILMLFMSMEDMVARDFDRGLELLKNISEKESAMVLKYQINELDFPATSYAAIQKTINFKDMPDFFSSSYQIISSVLKKKWKKPAGAPVAIFYTWDENTLISDTAAGFPIKGSVNSGEVKTITVPGGKAFMIEYHGPYEQSIYAYKAFDYYFATHNMKMKAPVIEEYITDPSKEADSSKWVTKIYQFAE